MYPVANICTRISSSGWDIYYYIHDIWQSQVFHSLKDVYSNAFFPPPAGEGQIVFSLSLDGFNPYSNKIAGMHVKSTGIWLVVLNLPPHLHYLHENVCHLGTILGSPSADQINHYLKLVVDILLEFCDPGVFFSWTSNYPSGRLFRAMLIPFLIGLPGVTMVHHFCSVCDLDYHDIDVLDSTEWPEKNANHICYFTGLWKDVESKQHQEIFEVYLPYWDPLCYTVIGSMHVLDLGLFCTHCLKIFQISSKQLGGDGTIMKPSLVKLKQVPMICINEMKMVLKLLSFDCEVLLSADQWRIVGTIHLPIMLIWLWVNETAQKQDLLNSFMNLVSTVCIVNMCISSPNQSQAYKDHVFCYHLKPIYHAALHIGNFLQLFAPVHSHSTPLYEHIINFLHRMDINLKPSM
ncbi:hypothetical protein L208DRAFT_1425884 [Tricholoma matsutake]|nr:hypothetical protein L208DRAFT_1425884 [Tricholoma matsutake 945]